MATLAPTSGHVPRPPSTGRPASASGKQRPRPQSAHCSVGRGASGGPGPPGTTTAFGATVRPQQPPGAQQAHGNPGKRLLPAELGLAGRRVLALPSHLDQCDKGEQCCWRWLAHAVLKEVTWLKEDLDSAREGHLQHTLEKQKAEHDAEAYAELRGAHTAAKGELAACRAEVHDLRRDLVQLQTTQAQRDAREQELEREVSRFERDLKLVSAREEAAVKRAVAAEQELVQARRSAEENRLKVLSMEDLRVRLAADLHQARVERDGLRKAADSSGARSKKKKRGGASGGRSPHGGARSPRR